MRSGGSVETPTPPMLEDTPLAVRYATRRARSTAVTAAGAKAVVTPRRPRGTGPDQVLRSSPLAPAAQQAAQALRRRHARRPDRCARRPMARGRAAAARSSLGAVAPPLAGPRPVVLP